MQFEKTETFENGQYTLSHKNVQWKFTIKALSLQYPILQWFIPLFPQRRVLVQLRVQKIYPCNQGWDKYCPAGKFQWKMMDNAGTANTPKITEVANTGTYEQNWVKTSEKVRFFDVLGPHDSKFPHF